MTSSTPNLRELFEAAVALEASARAAFLDAHCADAGRRAEVEALIAADADAAEPLPSGTAGRLADAIGTPKLSEPLAAGRRIGSFELVEPLGEGGSSTVFHATRDIEGVTQHVALKLMRRGLYNPEAERLFRREQSALVQLRHPNIARMIDGGVTEQGLPYIVLELVVGRTLTDHAQVRELGLRERLALFTVVCQAVDSAHRALIVHRDLKPSNVLVTEEGEVKLLDFGIAKLLGEDDGQTHTQMPAFTPAYAAPEQRDGGPITTATDVYALGILLGELITGERINDGSGRTPSSRIESPSGADSGATVTRITPREVRGDLDAIVLKALDADPGRRYASAGRLSDDIERLLEGRPVSAHPPSRWYRTRKFMLRHKGSVAATAVFVLTILAALGTALWQARVAREQAAFARNESARANATLGFVVELLKTASADLPKDERPTPELLVRNAAANAREDPELDPLVRAQLLQTLAEIARSSGDTAAAEALIDEAIERERALGLPATSPQWIAALVSKGNLLHSTNRTRQADQLMQELVPKIEAVDSEDAVSALMLYATTRAYARDSSQASEIARKAVAKVQRVFGADSINAIETATFLGQLCSNLGRYRDSEAILEEAMGRWRALKLPIDEQYARSLFHLAVTKQRIGKRTEVEPLFREGIELMRRVQEVPYHRISQGLVGYANFLIEEDRFEEARTLLDEALVNDEAAFGLDHTRTANTLDALGLLQLAAHDPIASESSIGTALGIAERHAREAGFEREFASIRMHAARVDLALGRVDDAATRINAAMPTLVDTFGARSVAAAAGHVLLGEIALTRPNGSAALRESDQAIEWLRALDLPWPIAESEARALRARALLAAGRVDEADAEVREAITNLRTAVPAATTRASGLLVLRSRIERALGDTTRADATLAEARRLAPNPKYLAPEDRLALGLPTATTPPRNNTD